MNEIRVSDASDQVSGLFLIESQEDLGNIEGEIERVVTPNRARRFGRCGFEGKLYYDDNLDIEREGLSESIALHIGTWLHNVVEQAAGGVSTPEDLRSTILEGERHLRVQVTNEQDASELDKALTWLNAVVPIVVMQSGDVLGQPQDVVMNERVVGFYDKQVKVLYACRVDQAYLRNGYVSVEDTKSVGASRNVVDEGQAWLRSWQAKIQGVCGWLWAQRYGHEGAMIAIRAYSKRNVPKAPERPQTCDKCTWDHFETFDNDAHLAIATAHPRMQKRQEHWQEQHEKIHRWRERTDKYERDRRDFGARVFGRFTKTVGMEEVQMWIEELWWASYLMKHPSMNPTSCYVFRPCMFNQGCPDVDPSKFVAREMSWADEIMHHRVWPSLDVED